MNDPNIKPKHGGRRPGAGRPTADHVHGVHNYQVMLTPTHYKHAKLLGDGNISLGLRRALDAYFDTGQAAIENPRENQSGDTDPDTSPGLEKLAPEVKTPE